MSRLQSGKLDTYDVEILAAAGASQAIPGLEQRFAHESNESLKAKIASGLIRLGDRGIGYWSYLAAWAAIALDSDIPDAVFDSEGKGSLKQLSPELISWAKVHNVSENDAAVTATYDYPARLLVLGESGDPRGVPILQRALLSRDGAIVVVAVLGLAQAKDAGSVPLIISALRKMPWLAGAAARYLVYFDDSRADDAVNTYVPQEQARLWRQQRAEGIGPFGHSILVSK